MSKTDKDRPYWVQANDSTTARKVYHSQRNIGGSACWIECTANTKVEIPKHEWRSHNGSLKINGSCGHVLDVDHTWRQTPTREDRRVYIYGPLRAAERAYTRAATNSYNTYGQDWDDEGMEPYAHAEGKNLKQYWRW